MQIFSAVIRRTLPSSYKARLRARSSGVGGLHLLWYREGERKGRQVGVRMSREGGAG